MNERQTTKNHYINVILVAFNRKKSLISAKYCSCERLMILLIYFFKIPHWKNKFLCNISNVKTGRRERSLNSCTTIMSSKRSQ